MRSSRELEGEHYHLAEERLDEPPRSRSPHGRWGPPEEEEPWEGNTRDFLQTTDLIDGRVWSSNMRRACERDAHMQHLAFFQNPVPGVTKTFAWIPIWRLAQTDRPLDEIVLGTDLYGQTWVQFNAKPAHGSWVYDQVFLDIKVNVRYGEPGNHDAPDIGKWIRFQNIPGTTTWIRAESNDYLGWAVVLTALV